KKTIPCEDKSFDYWYGDLNHSGLDRFEEASEKYKLIVNEIKKPINTSLSELRVIDSEGNENVMLSLTFQLNQLLMLINNPMYFPHKAYVNMFNGVNKTFAKTISSGSKKAKKAGGAPSHE
ncbi:MAG: hypothetical protein K6T85_15885, partial [Gorillibacterium sp.]|nr:hypothetical protein [Gorillibacterium sp.]